MARDAFASTTAGLDTDGFPMRLYRKALQHGTWDPYGLDLDRDREQWARLDDDERDLVLRLTTLFQGGEEAVTLDLLPLIRVIADEGRVEEEMFLSTFLADEAKHTAFFRRFLDEVAGVREDLTRYETDAYRAVFHVALPEALRALADDASPAAQVRAAVTYNMIVEGVLAETGYHAYAQMLQERELLPGTRAGVGLLKQDESRHIAYGVYLIARLVAADDGLWAEVEATMSALSVPAMGVIDEALGCYDPVPFALRPESFTAYALDQLQRRLQRIEQARGTPVDELAF